MDNTHFARLFVANRRAPVVFNRLQQAATAADCGSFRQAADAISMKQSALSRSVQLVEHSFGVAIFERSSGGVRATPAGRHFLRIARSMLDQWRRLLPQQEPTDVMKQVASSLDFALPLRQAIWARHSSILRSSFRKSNLTRSSD
jgi:DNA-binding transcriptional LysR family regulator